MHHALLALGHDSVLTSRLDLDERHTIVLGGNLLARYASERYDSDERCDTEAGLAKLFVSEVARKVALTALGHVNVRLCSRYGLSARTQAVPPGCRSC